MRSTVRRPPTGEVSPCGHRPSGGDVACSVDVGVAPASSAGFTLEHRLALTVPGSDVPARGASLRRKRGRDLLDPTVSLVLQSRGEQPPAAVPDRPVQPALLSDALTGLLYSSARSAGHCPHVKGFDPDRVEAARNVSADLFDPVLAPVGLTGVQFRDRPFCSRSPGGATRGSGAPLLQHLQPLGLTPGQTGCVQQWPGDRSGDVGERDMPAAGPITGHPVGLDTRWHRPRHAKPHPAHLGHPHPTQAAVEPHHVRRFHRDLPKPFMHTSLAPRRATVRAGKEVSHGLREIPQRLLLHGLTAGTKPPVLGAGLGQLRDLLDVAGSLAPRLPMLLLLHRQIPHIPRIAAVRQQCLHLLSDGQQPKPRHIRTVTTTTDIPDMARQPHTEDQLPPRTEARIFQPKEIR